MSADTTDETSKGSTVTDIIRLSAAEMASKLADGSLTSVELTQATKPTIESSWPANVSSSSSESWMRARPATCATSSREREDMGVILCGVWIGVLGWALSQRAPS